MIFFYLGNPSTHSEPSTKYPGYEPSFLEKVQIRLRGCVIRSLFINPIFFRFQLLHHSYTEMRRKRQSNIFSVSVKNSGSWKLKVEIERLPVSNQLPLRLMNWKNFQGGRNSKKKLDAEIRVGSEKLLLVLMREEVGCKIWKEKWKQKLHRIVTASLPIQLLLFEGEFFAGQC